MSPAESSPIQGYFDRNQILLFVSQFQLAVWRVVLLLQAIVSIVGHNTRLLNRNTLSRFSWIRILRK